LDEQLEAREKWRLDAVKRAEERLVWAKKREGRRSSRPDAWTDTLRKRLVAYYKMGVLAPREQLRLGRLEHHELPASDRKRLSERGLLTRDMNVIGIGPDKNRGQLDLIDRALQLKHGARLRGGSLRILVYVDRSGLTIGASIQIQGTDAERNKPVYARYDLDVVPLGADPLTHFDAHWHYGEDPNDDVDPRWPTLVLDPDEVLDILVDMWFPRAPA